MSCVGDEAPTEPSGVPSTGALAVAPVVVDDPARSLSAATLQDAFDRLTCFGLVAVRTSNGEEAARERFEVSPGQEQYELSVDVELLGSPESFRVTITGYAPAGDDPCGFELFSGTRQVTVQADQLVPDQETPPTVPLAPSGPQAEASELRLEPGHAVLSGGGTVQLVPTLLDADGNTLAEGEDLAATLSWSSSGPAASVDDEGGVTGQSDGTVEVTATTLTDLSASVPVYVAGGKFAYVSGGDLIRTTVDGQDSETVASDASRPAWGPEGRLVYESGGSIQEVGGGTLIPGAGSPTFRPTGTHLTGASGGLVHATADGEFVAEDAVDGPANPQWIDETHIIGDGGSIVRVRADGTERTELTSVESDRLPSVGGGRILFLSDRGEGGTGVWTMGIDGGGATRVTPESFDASGRPSLSGGWILVPGSSERGSGLHLVPEDGSEPPLPLSIDAGTDPAWKTAVPTPEAPAIEITGTDPSQPRGGEEVTLLGSGFDWLVPKANTVEVPVLGASAAPAGSGTASSAAGTVEAEIVTVTPEELTFRAPVGLIAGSLTARTPSSEVTFQLDVPSGTLEVVAQTTGSSSSSSQAALTEESGAGASAAPSKPVDDIEIEVQDADGRSLGSRTTDDEGRVVFDNLPSGDFLLVPSPPEGFQTSPEIGPVRVDPDETSTVALDVVALPWTLTLPTTSITFNEPGLTRTVDATVEDIDGDPTDAALSVSRSTGSIFLVQADGFQLEFESLSPGNATATVTASRPSSVPPAPDSDDEAASTASSQPSTTATVEVRVLPPDEIIHEGDLIVKTTEDLADFQSAGYTHVDGSLTIHSSSETAEDPISNLNGMETLEEVTGDVYIQNNTALTDISGLRGLTTVGGDLKVVRNAALENLDGFGLSTLTSVGGQLAIVENDVLADVNGLSGLTSVGEHLRVVRNPELQSLGLSSLGSVGVGPCPDNTTDSFCGDLVLIDNPQVPNLDALSSLQSIGGGLIVEDMTALTDVSGLSNVTSMSNVIHFKRNPNLQSLSGLGSVSADLRMLQIIDNDNLVDLQGLAGIGSVELMVEILGNDGLERLDGLSGITSIGLDLIIENNPALQSISGGPGGPGLSNLQTIGHDLSVRNAPLVDDSETFPALTSVGGMLRLHNNPGVRMVLPQLSEVGAFVSVIHDDPDAGSSSNEPEFSGVTPVLEELSLPRLQSVGGYIQVRNNPALTSVEIASAPGVAPVDFTAEGFFRIQGNDALTSVDMGSLRSTGGSLLIKSNAQLTSLDLSSLQSVGSSLRVQSNGALGTLSLPNLDSVSSFLRIQDNGSLSSVDLSALSSVGRFVQIQGNDALGSTPGLTALGDGASLMVRGYDPEVESPAGTLTDLGTVGSGSGLTLSGLAVENNPDLTNLDGLSNVAELSGVDEAGNSIGDLDLVNNPSLSDISGLSGLTAADQIRIIDNPDLSAAAARSLADQAGALDGTISRFIQIRDNAAGPLVAVGAGSRTTCGLTDGTVAGFAVAFCWGADDVGQRGVGGGSRLTALTPEPVAGSHVFLGAPSAPSVGRLHVCGVESDGEVWCWGSNSSGQLGDGTTTDRTIPAKVVDSGSSIVFTSVSAGRVHTCGATGVLGDDGEVWCWGNNGRGQLGDGTITDRSQPVLVVDQSGNPVLFSTLSAGGGHTCGRNSASEIWCWGDNDRGQLGTGDTNDSRNPAKVVNSGSPLAFASVSAGNFHTCGALSTSSDDEVWCWGDNGNGQLGDGTNADSSDPVQVVDQSGNPVLFSTLSAGKDHTCALKSNGEIWCWGDNADGELGDGSTTDRSNPVKVTDSGTTLNFISVSAGDDNTCGITSADEAWCWGENGSGQLGNGTTSGSLVPVRVDHP